MLKATVTLTNLERLDPHPRTLLAYPHTKVCPMIFDAGTGQTIARLSLEEFLKHSEGIAKLSHQSYSKWFVSKVEIEEQPNDREKELLAALEEAQTKIVTLERDLRGYQDQDEAPTKEIEEGASASEDAKDWSHRQLREYAKTRGVPKYGQLTTEELRKLVSDHIDASLAAKTV